MTKTTKSEFASDVLDGLRARPRRLKSKYFYDERGSKLFDEICRLDEYYLTRCETRIMRKFASEMGQQLGPRVQVVEYGSGSSIKTRTLLDALIDPVAYVPVDISYEHLMRSAGAIADDYPNLEVMPLCADFTQPFAPPSPDRKPERIAVYFPGSTIGNFDEEHALMLLRQIRHQCGERGDLLIGFDLQKDRKIMEAAYNDARGVTAQFNLNLLHRMNRELDADFDLDRFEHLAYYNEASEAIETYIVSRADQVVTVAGEDFRFSEGERISTEYSHKYTIEGFAELAARVGLEFDQHWTDSRGYFAVAHLTASSDKM